MVCPLASMAINFHPASALRSSAKRNEAWDHRIQTSHSLFTLNHSPFIPAVPSKMRLKRPKLPNVEIELKRNTL